MRIEILLLYISLALCLLIPIICLILKENRLRRGLCYIIFPSLAGLLLIDVLLLIYYQIQSDFTFKYVYDHTCVNTKLLYKISALWAGQEGSFLLWSFIMATLGLFVLRVKSARSGRILALYSVLCGIIVFLTLRTNPFKLTDMAVSDGVGLNEALQNPWMVVHPPLVFISYSAMAVLLSLGISSIEKPVNRMADITKLWVRVSFLFLSIGIFTGSIWAYNALGWGGYWSWDPIENAALVPWLILCAYLHRKKSLSGLDCVIPFTLAGFGTFLARSGILQDKSVHAYAGGSDPLLTLSVFGLLILFVSGIILINLKARKKELKKQLMNLRALWKSTELLSLSTNLYAALIFLGTIIPLVTQISITAGYYNVISVIYVIIIILLLVIRNKEILLKKYVPILLLNTLLIILLIFTLQVVSFWLLLLWTAFIPVWLLLTTIKVKKLLYIISHFALLLLFAGAISASALSTKNTLIAELTEGDIHIDNHSISLQELQGKGCYTISSLEQDIIIKSTDVIAIDEKTILLSYTTKPLIILFWIGGSLLVLCLFITLLPVRYKKPILFLQSQEGIHRDL